MARRGFAVLIALSGGSAGACRAPACGEGTHLDPETRACAADLSEGPGSGSPADGAVVAGHYLPPLVELERVQGPEGAIGDAGAGHDRMHLTEVRYRARGRGHPAELFTCGYQFAAVDVDDPNAPVYLAQGFTHSPTPSSGKPPGCQHLAVDGDDPDLVFTANRGGVEDGEAFLSGWDLRERDGRLSPVEIPPLREPGRSYEGIDHEGGLLYAAMHGDGLGVYHLADPGAPLVADAVYAEGLSDAWDVVVRDGVAYVIDAEGLVMLDVSDPTAPRELGRLATGGTPRDVAVGDGLAFVAIGTGVVIADVSDPATPRQLGAIEERGDTTAVAWVPPYVLLSAWDDARVYDATDPADPTFVGAARITRQLAYEDEERPDPTARTLAVDGADGYVFVGNWFVPYVYALHPERVAPYVVLPSSAAELAFPTAAPGETASATLEVRNDGTAPLAVIDAWTDDPAFTVSPAAVAIAPGAAATLDLTFTAPDDAEHTTVLHLRTDDPSWPELEAWLVGNLDGLGVGDPMPEATADLLDGAPWSFTADSAGRVTLLAYFATF